MPGPRHKAELTDRSVDLSSMTPMHVWGCRKPPQARSAEEAAGREAASRAELSERSERLRGESSPSGVDGRAPRRRVGRGRSPLRRIAYRRYAESRARIYPHIDQELVPTGCEGGRSCMYHGSIRFRQKLAVYPKLIQTGVYPELFHLEVGRSCSENYQCLSGASGARAAIPSAAE